jgi:hypothetical protein
MIVVTFRLILSLTGALKMPRKRITAAQLGITLFDRKTAKHTSAEHTAKFGLSGF